MPSEGSGLPEGFDWSNGNVGSCGDLIVYSGARDAQVSGFEYDLFVTDPTFAQNKKLVMDHDLDDLLLGNESDPDTYQPAWSQDGRLIAASSYANDASTTGTLVLYSVSCASGVNVAVESETALMLSFGTGDHWWNNFTWNSSGQYLAMTVHNSSDANLWVADLGDPGQSGYPNAAPTLYRLTGVDRPFGSGAERIMSAAYAPGSDTIAFVTQASGSDRNDSLYTINAGSCVAALGGIGSISTACAATLITRGINAWNVDWRPNWPTPLQ
jgi:Tol biopolymer transport system component